MNRSIFSHKTEKLPEAAGVSAAPKSEPANQAAVTRAARGGFRTQTDEKPNIRTALCFVWFEDTAQGARFAVQLAGCGDSDGIQVMTGEDSVPAFLEMLDTHQPRIVTYGGRTGFMSWLRIQCMRNELSSKHLQAGTRYSNFGTRFVHEYLVDLSDILSDYAVGPVLSFEERLAQLYMSLPDPLSDHYPEQALSSLTSMFRRWQIFVGERCLKN